MVEVDVGEFQGLLRAVAGGDGFDLEVNRLGRGRADFLAHDAFGVVAPGQAAALVKEGRAQAHGRLGRHLAHLVRDLEVGDGAGRADLAA